MTCTAERVCWEIDGKSIIENIDLCAKEGKITGIIGPNGSGKTTLLKNIYRVLKPDSGTVYINELNIHKISNRESARQIAVVAQEETGEFDFSVEEIILMGRYPYKGVFETDSIDDKEIVQKAMLKTGLHGFEARRFVTLSGGEKQRVLIARALAQQAKIIILDEPTNHLDIGFKLQVFDIIKELNFTVVAAIHDINLAALYCDTLYVLCDGNVRISGTPEEVLTKSLMSEVFGVNVDININSYTGRPQIYFLGAAVPTI